MQPSSLIRFSQAMGYQGFSELQEIFRARLRDRVPNYEERIAQLREHARSASKAHILFEGFSEAAQKSIADLASKLEPKTLDKAVARLAAAQTIYIIGLRRSFPISSYMAYAFGKLGIRHVLVDGLGGLASNDLTFATSKDAVLAVSFTPYASETVTLVTPSRSRQSAGDRHHRQRLLAAGARCRNLARSGGSEFRRLPLARRHTGAGHDDHRGGGGEAGE